MKTSLMKKLAEKARSIGDRRRYRSLLDEHRPMPAPAGHLPLCVGEEQRRFVVPTSFLSTHCSGFCLRWLIWSTGSIKRAVCRSHAMFRSSKRWWEQSKAGEGGSISGSSSEELLFHDSWRDGFFFFLVLL
ncbi:hypothetical protein QJS10_CPA08g01451 [Acorus calamus]|uniref:Uncharacterized protein n=1 Tax=Acorus calamus TaxID=4465 RepID=A0AAV9EDG5_ACOCL|nr:hypothetical protein QJS10_CPA08g01451 [Acorus calamus]